MEGLGALQWLFLLVRLLELDKKYLIAQVWDWIMWTSSVHKEEKLSGELRKGILWGKKLFCGGKASSQDAQVCVSTDSKGQ